MSTFEDKIWDRVYDLNRAFSFESDRKLFLDVLGEVFDLKIEKVNAKEYDTVSDKARNKVSELLREFPGHYRDILFQELEEAFQIQIKR